MAQTTTLVLLPETAWTSNGAPVTYDVVGNKQPAASYYLANQSLQTINVSCGNVSGNITIEATLVTNPSENDWFKTFTLECNPNATANTDPANNANAQLFTNIQGSYVWMRAVVYDFGQGVIDYVKLSY